MTDDELKSALNKAKTTPMNFALLVSGTTCTGLLVSKKPVRSSDAKKLKTETHAKKIHMGICEGTVGGLLFRFDASDTPGNEPKLKKFITEKTNLKLGIVYEAAEGLSPVDDAVLDIAEERKALGVTLTKLAALATKVIKAAPERRNELVARLGEAKALIGEISEERPERIEHAKVFIAAFLKELKGPPAPVDANDARDDAKDTPSPAVSQLSDTDKAFISGVLGGDDKSFAAFHAQFDAKDRAELSSIFGGERGLRAVGKMLRDVCGNDPAKLKSLADAMG